MVKDKKVGYGIVGALTLAVLAYGLSRALKPPPLERADISLSNLIISPLEVNPGQPVTISVTATNIGGEAGSYIVELGGDFMATKSVSLNPGESKVVSFTVTPTEAGEFFVSVDGLSGSFSVSAGLITLFGTIIDATTGYPLRGVAITLFNTLYMLKEEGGVYEKIYTDSNGFYSVAIPPGEYVALAQKLYYTSKWLYGGQEPTGAWIWELISSDTQMDIVLEPRVW